MTNINDVLKSKNNQDEKEEKKVDVFTQLQREMIKMSILKIAMRRFQMSEMSGDKDYSDPLSEVQGAEVVLENTLSSMSPETRENYFAQVSQRAQSKGVNVEDILADDAIKLKKAEVNSQSYHIDPTSGRVKVDGEDEDDDEKDCQEEEDDLDDEIELKLD